MFDARCSMLAGNIIPIGGTSIMAGFNDRLQRQLSGSVSSVCVAAGDESRGSAYFCMVTRA
jgi:hypothetical protein